MSPATAVQLEAKNTSGLVVQILKVTDALLQISYCPVPVSVMYMRPLKWIFLFLLAFSVITMWYVTFSSNTVIERTNLLYFYEYEPVYKQHYLFTLRERLNCKDINPFLVILVSSRPKDVKSRQAIRITWGSQNFWWGHQVLTLFLLGEDTQREDDAAALSVEDESILYGDIIRQDFMDTYDNLTLKTIMAFSVRDDGVRCHVPPDWDGAQPDVLAAPLSHAWPAVVLHLRVKCGLP
ncbi:UDP-GalNAc:beta-1,3-N-acetylgalactosaminyltransferase 1 isoform X3 [Aquila chrysaetos chrysaetos]|uniref:UDP-GalNAc:beta-1, 3-N-acetylgalactosaminyltransferase 1 isoform X3 n=1 Tax=Aquila chrysaetos chrysaetos TaxID=223781 RepID=UPI0011767A1E|nr:UDP-GalNAc:beta-1,3-N-acetylgalactosaminyltransferase 1 isoform X3 [Aquila chrysaetos chrysaetos]